jgi:hypothetical protein
MTSRTRRRRGRFEIRDLLPGWSANQTRYLSPSEDDLEPVPNVELDYSIELAIGLRSEAATGRFTLSVVTPEALLKRDRGDGTVLSDRATLIVSKADWDEIRAHLESVVEGCSATTFDEATDYFNQYSRNEFDGYWFRPSDLVRRRESAHPLEIRQISCVDGRPFRSLYPTDAIAVDYDVRINIGRTGEPEEAAFRVRIVSARALEQQVDGEFRVLADRGTLVVGTFDWRDVLAHIEHIMSDCEAERLQGSVTLLERYFVQE